MPNKNTYDSQNRNNNCNNFSTGNNMNSIGLSKTLEDNIKLFQNTFSGDKMFITRSIQNRYMPEVKCVIFYFEDMINAEIINENVIKPILFSNLSTEIDTDNLLSELQYKILMANNVFMEINLSTLISAVLSGDTIFLIEGYDCALIIESKGLKGRAITEPESSRVIRGPREGFTESIRVNISLIRRKIRNADLKFKYRELGERTRTQICICYMEGIARKEILEELERRLDKICIDGILDSGYIQELIKDAPFSPFETVGYSERPDVVASKLLEGRIALIVDGSPVVLTVPFIIIETAQANEDYYSNYIFASLNRIMRSLAAIMSVSIPSIYLALVTFHQEMLPTPFLMSISAGRQGVPIPTVASLIIMLTAFDLLREASVRMPAPIGQAINIVGTLIIGQALVEAKLVSPTVIIVTAFAGILSLLNLSMIGATIIFRAFLLVFTAILGIYGFLLGFILLLIHIMNIRSFGVPYLLNLTSLKDHNFQDAWIRAPWWEMTLRPKIIAVKNLKRQLNKKDRGN